MQRYQPAVHAPEATCTGKEGFATYSLAAQVAGRRRRRDGRAPEPYRCPICSQFHIGNPSLPKGRRVRRFTR